MRGRDSRYDPGCSQREFIAGLGGAAVWPLAAGAQQPAMAVVGFVHVGPADAPAGLAAAFRKELRECGYVEGQNVTVEYHWLDGQFGRLPALMADLARRRVAVIATPAGPTAAVVAEAATATIPIVFAVGENPVTAHAIGLQVRVLNAITSREIDAVFATVERERLDALFVAGGPFLGSPGVQIVSLVARDRIPAVYGCVNMSWPAG